MPNGRPSLARDARIAEQIIVDCHDESEREMGWYCYLQENLQFPFTARCILNRAISPLRVGDEVEVMCMAPERECEHEVFVMIRWDRKAGLGVPLAQLRTAASEECNCQAVEDWHCWVRRRFA